MTDRTFADMMDLDRSGTDLFVGVGPRYPWGGLFGGQIVAQSLRAAGLTVDPAFLPHSLHGYFIRRGDDTLPITFEVDRLRDGRSFVTRRVVARQHTDRGDLAIFSTAASFQVAEDSVDVAVVEPPPSLAAGPDAYDPETWSHVFERRQVAGRGRGEHTGVAEAWFRMGDAVGDDPLAQACALAYLSDDLPTEAVVADHPDSSGVFDDDAFDLTFVSASLDHAIWFHRPLDPSEWHLHRMASRGITGSRGLSSGEVFAADGTHAATVAQEVLLRRRTR